MRRMKHCWGTLSRDRQPCLLGLCTPSVTDGLACWRQAPAPAGPAEAVLWRAKAHLRTTVVAAEAPAWGTSAADSATQAAPQTEQQQQQQQVHDTTQGRLEHRLDSLDNQQQGGSSGDAAQGGGGAAVHEQPHATSYAAWIHGSSGGSGVTQAAASGVSPHVEGGFQQPRT